MKRASWTHEQKQLDAWRYWNSVADYARRVGQNAAIKRSQARIQSESKLTWRQIDRATVKLREQIGIGGAAWEPVPQEMKRR